MGELGQGRGDQVGGRSLNRPAARVVPDVYSFAVDGGFWYSIPQHLETVLETGTIVRVPLSGRRVRGWVVEVGRRGDELKDVLAVSAEMPIFDKKLLEALEWAAHHYVAPLAVVLAKATPPNLPGRVEPNQLPGPETRDSAHPMGEMAMATREGRRRPVLSLVGRWHDLDWLPNLSPALSDRSVLVVAATGAEVDLIADRASKLFGDRVVKVPTEPDAAITRSWEMSQVAGRLVVSTPRAVVWRIRGLGLAVVLEEGRRAMKDRQTPTIHTRDMIRTRSRLEGFNVVFFGPTPSVELLAAGSEIVRVANRAWGLVEVVDRSKEPPGSGLISEVVTTAIRAVGKTAGEKTFVLTTPTMMERTVLELVSKLGEKAAGAHPAGVLVSVGTEADLAALDPVALTVAANVDALLMARGYRATEEALRQLARLGNSLAAGRGRRMMIQTQDPGSHLVETLRRGDPVPYLERVLVDRARSGAPPSVEMIALELRGDPPEGIDPEIRSLPDADVHGPIVEDGVRRWLLVGHLGKTRLALRPLAGRWRERGTTVRIDADPIDL